MKGSQGETPFAQTPGAVVALAGRRIDADGSAPPRFPLSAVDRVREELAALLHPAAVSCLVCSAACGADLLALDVAARQGIERHVVLPYGPERFRATSVADRPGEWGPLFDRVIAGVRAAGHLETGQGDPESEAAYAWTNERIIARATELAGTRPRLAVVVWEGSPRGEGDMTADFLRRASRAGFGVRAVPT